MTLLFPKHMVCVRPKTAVALLHCRSSRCLRLLTAHRAQSPHWTTSEPRHWTQTTGDLQSLKCRREAATRREGIASAGNRRNEVEPRRASGRRRGVVKPGAAAPAVGEDHPKRPQNEYRLYNRQNSVMVPAGMIIILFISRLGEPHVRTSPFELFLLGRLSCFLELFRR